ncbi:MAG: hypothetical protein WDM76_03865 [Limisphaerales bacterium]
MKILLAFAPFLAFAVVDRLVGATAGLAAGAIVSAILLVRDAMNKGRKIKVLEAGTMILFGGLAIYSFIGKVDWSIVGVRLCVDAGLLVIVLISMAIRQPFTLQYAREEVEKELWDKPEFVRVNYVITAVWAAAFAVMVGADLVMLYLTNIPMRVGNLG